MPKRIPTPEPTGLGHQPFASLAGRFAGLPQAADQPVVQEPLAATPTPTRAMVRLERKGRRGKVVTIVEGLDLDAPVSEAWLRDLKAAIGCGGTSKDGGWVLQGDHRKRVKDWLEQRGVHRAAGAV